MPPDDLKALLTLSSMSQNQTDSLIANVSDFKSALKGRSIQRQVQLVLENLGIEDSAALSRVLLTLHMSYFRSGSSSIKEFIEDVVCQTDLHQREVLRERLERFLKIRVIAVSIKASAIQVSHDRVYNSCFIATVIRPVFEDPVCDGLAGSLIVHQMRLTSIRNRKQEDLFFALDDDDLRSLSSAITRALEKSDHLRLLLKSFAIHQLDGDGK